MADRQHEEGDARFVRRVLIVVGIVFAVGIAVTLRHILILVFGSVVIAVLLGSVTAPIQRVTRLRRGLALAIAVLLVVAILAATGALIGSTVAAQAQQLEQSFPQAWSQVRMRLSELGIALPPLENLNVTSGESPLPGDGGPRPDPESAPGGALNGSAVDIFDRATGLVMSVFGAIASTLLVIAGAIYLAAQPGLYRTGVIKLFPKQRRALAADTFDECGKALKLWLLGTLVSMGLVGAGTTAGLYLLGIPSALTLGVLAGVLEFIPIIGPIAASIPAIVLAWSNSTELAIWTAGLFLLIQQIEGNVIQPIVQRYAVDLPPVVLLFSVVAGGLLFGLVGVIFAAPLTVVGYVVVKRLYVREVLGTETPLPAAESERSTDQS